MEECPPSFDRSNRVSSKSEIVGNRPSRSEKGEKNNRTANNMVLPEFIMPTGDSFKIMASGLDH